jgi:hypothetical protein
VSTATAVLGLQRADFTEQQVEALAEFASAQLDITPLATTADLLELKADLRREIAATWAELIK